MIISISPHLGIEVIGHNCLNRYEFVLSGEPQNYICGERLFKEQYQNRGSLSKLKRILRSSKSKHTTELEEM